MNESEFVSFLEKKFPFSHGVGIGDDAAVIKTDKNYFSVITKDILVENVHFKFDYFSLENLVEKSIAVNLSDIAAMGALPEYFFLGLGVPDKFSNNIKSFFSSIDNICKRYNLELAGGDYSKSDLFFISITMVGKTNKPIYRKNAENGDLICITKNPGESAIGLKLLQKNIDKSKNLPESIFIDKHIKVIPEMDSGRILTNYVNSMMDISDGLIKDLKRILFASKKGAILHYDKIPVSKLFKDTCIKYQINEFKTVLSGGEDYGLLFTISKEKEKLLQTEGITYTIVGEILNNEELKILYKGKKVEIDTTGYDHFLT